MQINNEKLKAAILAALQTDEVVSVVASQLESKEIFDTVETLSSRYSFLKDFGYEHKGFKIGEEVMHQGEKKTITGFDIRPKAIIDNIALEAGKVSTERYNFVTRELKGSLNRTGSCNWFNLDDVTKIEEVNTVDIPAIEVGDIVTLKTSELGTSFGKYDNPAGLSGEVTVTSNYTFITVDFGENFRGHDGSCWNPGTKLNIFKSDIAKVEKQVKLSDKSKALIEELNKEHLDVLTWVKKEVGDWMPKFGENAYFQVIRFSDGTWGHKAVNCWTYGSIVMPYAFAAKLAKGLNDGSIKF